MDGFERFAQGQLITLFSATNYCGKEHISCVCLVPEFKSFNCDFNFFYWVINSFLVPPLLEYWLFGTMTYDTYMVVGRLNKMNAEQNQGELPILGRLGSKL